MKIKLISDSKENTIKLGMTISEFLFPSSVITLSGDLGAGKTTFCGGLAKGLNIQGRVISPTFNIMKNYFEGKMPLHHIDAYRLSEGNKDIGLEEFIESDGVCVIEWPEFISDLIDNNKSLVIKFYHEQENVRTIEIESNNIQYEALFQELERLV